MSGLVHSILQYCSTALLYSVFLLQEVIRLESLCKELYTSQDAGVRTEAEKALVAFQNSPDSLGKLLGALELTLIIICRKMSEAVRERKLSVLAAVGHHHHHQADQSVLPEPGAGQQGGHQELRPQLPLDSTQAGPVRCPGHGHSLLSHHQARLVRQRQGRVRVQSRHQ